MDRIIPKSIALKYRNAASRLFPPLPRQGSSHSMKASGIQKVYTRPTYSSIPH